MKIITILTITSLALSSARAVIPLPEGGYPGNNTATGEQSLFSLDTSQGYYNVADGFASLYYTTTGQANTALGSFTLFLNTTGSFNTAVGDVALFNSTIGGFNTAIGFRALVSLQTGQHNIGVGLGAGANLVRGDGNIYIGNQGVLGENGSIRIGTAGEHTSIYLAGALDPISNASSLGIDQNGKLGVITQQGVKQEELERQIEQLQKQVEALTAGLQKVSAQLELSEPARHTVSNSN
jgi:hypothetical protein